MIYELNHLGIVTADLDRSVAFYVDLLGAQPVWSAEVAASGMRIAYLQLAQGLVELIEFAGGAAPAGANHLGFLSDDLDSDVERLRGTGAEITVEPRATGSGVGRQALVLDPDGVSIELLQRDLPLRDGTTAHPHIHAIDHVALQADDHDRSLAFYRDGLGMAVARQTPIPALDTMLTYLNHGEDVVELLPKVHDGARLHHLALIVDDVDAALARLVADGGEPDGPSRPAAGGVGRVGSVTDPNGVVIEFVDRPRVLEG